VPRSSRRIVGMRVVCFALSAGLLSGAPSARPAQANPPQGAGARPQPTNRLGKETSPYLLMHAHNPVDWHAWNEAALARAKAEKKLIFLSVGYSSCYWCHVMERESFMDPEVAAYLNKHFICIKVDREERPDIDEIYMTSLQLLGRRGGWPLTVFLTPDAKPFYGGTYFPPRDKEAEVPAGTRIANAARPMLPGLLPILKAVEAKWTTGSPEIQASANATADAVRRALARRSPIAASLPTSAALNEVQTALADEFDPTYGGFGYSAADDRRPKFPEPSNLVFLLDRVRRSSDPQAKNMLLFTLDKMAAGGIHDQIGGGFHRYSTDRRWQIPHFEKMLYDNGQLASVYAQAFTLSGRTEYKAVVDDLLAFVTRELASPERGFYTALDAETDGHEGRYYAWSRPELQKLLTADEFNRGGSAYGFSSPANFEGLWVLFAARPLAAGERQQLAALRQKLLAARNQRKRPLTDTKTLAGDTGLMIRGFADAGRAFNDENYKKTATRAAEFVLAKLRTPDGRLLHSFTAGQAKLNAYLDDYAFFIDGLIALHQATGEDRWLQTADDLSEMAIKLFWDAEVGGFYFTSHDHETLISRSKNPVDSALPSGNAVMACNLVYLAQARSKPKYLEHAEKTIVAFAPFLERAPSSMPRMAVALAALLDAKQPAAATEKPR
jgi:uncharacterized protein YyaL (SSP411 family)